MFAPTEGEHLEELASYGSAPVRAAARLIVAIQAQGAAIRATSRARPAPEATRPARARSRSTTMVRVAYALVTLVALAAAIAAVVVTPRGHSVSTERLATAGATIGAGGTSPNGTGRPARPARPAPTGATAAPVSARAPAPGAAIAPELAAPLSPPITPASPLSSPRDPVPVGKGTWVIPTEPNSQLPAVDPHQVVAQAVGAGLTHLFVMAGSSAQGFDAGGFLDQLLPAAHAAGLRVLAWDVPSLVAPAADVARAHQEAAFTTPGGQRVDGLAIDFSQAGTLAAGTASGYGDALRRAVGTAYPLIAVVAAPAQVGTDYPYARLLAPFDAVAPLVALGGADPASAVQTAVAALAPYGIPELAVAVGANPVPAQISEFVAAADRAGAVGISLRSPPAPATAPAPPPGQTLSAAPQFDLTHLNPSSLLPTQIRAFQAELASLGFSVPLTGVLDPATMAALAAYQQSAALAPTGVLTQATQTMLLAPLAIMLP